MKLVLHPRAEQERDAAVLWYAERSLSAAEGLVFLFARALERIEAAPHLYPIDPLESRARRVRLATFPYAIIFSIHGETVRVLAFAHAKRRPGYWLGRM